jgi:predicted dienelactone hydrolase
MPLRTLTRLAAALACLLCAAGAQAREQTLRLPDGLQVTAWTPDAALPGRLPVLVFSHGLHGCDVQARFLTQGLANAGYVVFAPNHRDASCNGGITPWFEGTELAFLQPDRWNEASYGNRADDVRKLIAGLYEDERFRNRADWSRLGLVGHSLGGYTVLGLAGAWPGWKLPGVKAVLALAPYSHPFDFHSTLGGLAVPVMYQCGQNDFAITPEVSQISYAATPQPRYYVELANAGHFAWTDHDATGHRAILAYATAFLDHYVKGLPASTVLTQPMAGVSQLRYASELGSNEAAPAPVVTDAPAPPQ